MKFLRPVICVFCLIAIGFFLESCGPEEEEQLPKATHLYFSDFSGKKIGVVDLTNLNSFTTIADASDGLDTLAGIAIDFVGGKVYAAEELNNRIVRFNLDGSGTLDVVYEFEMNGVDSLVLEPTAVAVDRETDALYWTNSGTGRLLKGKMDGTANISFMYDSADVLTYSYGLVLNKTIDRLFFSDFGTFAGIYLGETGETTTRPSRWFFPSYALRNPSQIYLEERTQAMYWADETVSALVVGGINSQAFSVIYDDEDGIEHPSAIAVDNGSKKIYWSEPANKTIKRANLDGTGEEEVVLTGVESYSIVLRFDNQ
jgi:DNA-binding beta-propeller fold protein YncE